MIGSIALTVVLVVTMILNAPIIDYRTITNGTMSTRQISIMKYFKVWQPLVQKEGTLQKPVNTDASALNLKQDENQNVDPKDDGLDLDQIVEGQYTVLLWEWMRAENWRMSTGFSSLTFCRNDECPANSERLLYASVCEHLYQ